MKKLLLMLLGVLMTLPMLARDFEYTYDGQTLYYTVISEEDKTCALVGYNGNDLGDLIIPAVAIDEKDNRYLVTVIGYGAFLECNSLTSVTIPDSVTEIGVRAFNCCISLTSVTIPASVESIERGSFSCCDHLEEILVAESSQNYCSVDGVLFDKEQTMLIQFPGGRSGSYVIPNSVTAIGMDAFYTCSSLASVTIPASVTTIGELAFSGCNGLTSVTLPNSVTEIGYGAFSNCSSLISFTLPNSVTKIVGGLLMCCPSLRSVYYNAEEPIESVRWEFGDEEYENATLYVPAAAVEKCKLIDPWKNFKSIVAYDFTGINDVAADIDGNLPCEVYTTSGVKVADSLDGLGMGIYIVLQGNAVKKIVVN